MRWFCTNCGRPVDVSEVKFRGNHKGDYAHKNCEYQVTPIDQVLVIGQSNITLSNNMFVVSSPNTPIKVYPFEKFWQAVERAVTEELPDEWDSDPLIDLLKKKKKPEDE